MQLKIYNKILKQHVGVSLADPTFRQQPYTKGVQNPLTGVLLHVCDKLVSLLAE